MRYLALFALAVVTTLTNRPPAPAQGRAVVLVTLDGARTEEMFGGLDIEAARSSLKREQVLEAQPFYLQYWADTPDARRERLMPFFWKALMREHGSIAGNRARGSQVSLSNTHWFSYPGYSEMLVGRAHDEEIKSNDPVRNPHTTVLEFLRDRAGLSRSQVAVFASWSVFSAIAEHKEAALTINAGFAAFDSPDPVVRRESALQFETPTPWDTVRHDAYTVRFAMDYLKRHRPRVLYLALGETDDWAHDGRYDRVLQTYARTDHYLKELWQWLQSQPDYRDQTSLLITTDHGRGRTAESWRNHGKDVEGAGDTWMAFVSPSMARRGEWRDHAPISTSQVAGTLISWMGLEPRAFADAAPPVADNPTQR